MSESSTLELFLKEIPQTRTHMLCWFASEAANGRIRDFLAALISALTMIDAVTPGYAKEMIGRIASIKGLGVKPYEAIVQILGEIYVTTGALDAADRDTQREYLFAHEPRVKKGKNPEFEVRADGIWFAVEVKTPELAEFSTLRQRNRFQLTTRLPRASEGPLASATLPRDNPVKDYLMSANAKFEAYQQIRPEAFCILTIVWDDFCNEPIAALTNPMAGLFTDQSFCRDAMGAPRRFPFVDGVVVCRHRHQIDRALRDEPLADGVTSPFSYQTGNRFPFKAFVQNPHGRRVPDELVSTLNAEHYSDLLGAEYNPTDLVMWLPLTPAEVTADLHLEVRDHVERRAYAIWESEGRPNGRDFDHWMMARREMRMSDDVPL